MIKGYIFDFDGVILNTEKYHYLSWKEAFNAYQIFLFEEDYLPLKSTGRKHIVETILKSKKVELSENEKNEIMELKGEYYNIFSKHFCKNDLILGIEAFLHDAKKNNIKMGVASSSKFAKTLLEKLELEKFFDFVVDANTKTNPKPAPDMFLLVANNLNLQPSEIIVFEDSVAGIEAGMSGGFNVIGIGAFLIKYCKTIISDFSAQTFSTIQSIV